jgi:L-fuconolactonase
MEEDALDPDRVIIDPHLHLWDIRAAHGGLQQAQTFLVQDAARLICASGHRVTHTVFVEAHAMHRQDGPSELKSLGETEFANGMAAMAASGAYGPCLIADRIVTTVDLCLGDAVEPILDAHRARAGERLAGVRMNTSFSSAGLFGAPAEAAAEERIGDARFVQGARVLARRGLSLDVWCLHPQLPQLISLARQVPELTIVLDHVGTPDLRGGFAARPTEAFAEWKRHIGVLAQHANVRVKLSGLGMDVPGPLRAVTGATPSEVLAQDWKTRVDVAIEAFGTNRCMFASNYPAERAAGSYGAIWNAFKRLSAPCSDAEKDQLFHGTAAETYRIDLRT